MVANCGWGITYQSIQGLTDFNQMSPNQSISIRGRRKIISSYDYTKKAKATESELEKLDHFSFYDKSEVVDLESVTFLGKTDHSYCLKIYRKLYNLSLSSTNIESQKVDKLRRSGY